MSDPETTLPPRQPNTPRTWLRRAWAAVLAHPDRAIIAAAIIAAFLLGRCSAS